MAEQHPTQRERQIRYIVVEEIPYEGIYIANDTGSDGENPIPTFATHEEAEAHADKLRIAKGDRLILAVRP